MEKKYAKFDKKVKDIETQLKPILSVPPNLQFLPSDDNQLVVERFTEDVHFMNKLISREMAPSSSNSIQNTTLLKNRRLSRLGSRVRLLLKVSRHLAGGLGSSNLVNSVDSSQSSAVIDSCLTDNDENYDSDNEVVERGVFEVYENPTYEGDFGDIENEYGDVDGVNKKVVMPFARAEEEVVDNNYDNDQDGEVIQQERVTEKKDDNKDEIDDDQNEGVSFEDATEEEDLTQDGIDDNLGDQGFVQEAFKEETVGVDCQEDNRRKAAKDSGKCCCYKSIFCSILIGMGMVSMLLLQYYFPDFPDHYSAPFPPPT